MFNDKPMDDVLAMEPQQRNRTVVRLRTTMWRDKNGLYVRKSLMFLRRKSEGFNALEEDAGMVGAGVVSRIVNMDECRDGIYEVVTCNETRDYETGYVDDYDYRLVAANNGESDNAYHRNAPPRRS